MKELKPTVKRDLSLFSVQAWQQGYGKYLKKSLDWYYPVIFHYDGEKVNFYHSNNDFKYFKEIITGKIIDNKKLFKELNSEFISSINKLKKINVTSENLENIFRLIGQIMSFYIFVVSDRFVKAIPEAWDSRVLSEGILYSFDSKIEDTVNSLLKKSNINKNLKHIISYKEIQQLLKGKSINQQKIRKRSQGYIVEDENILNGNNFADFCSKKGINNPEVNKEVFEKVYTRDTTIIIQESWGKACRQYVQKNWGWKNPHKPLVIHYFKNGTIEIWENISGTEWLKDQILKENKKSDKFYKKIGKKFEKDYALLKKEYLNKKHLSKKTELKKFVEKVDKLMFGFLIYYYSAIDERTPKAIKSLAQGFREKETFFASSSELIRNSLLHIYPNLKGFETTILSSEISNPPDKVELKKRLNDYILVDGIKYGKASLDIFAEQIGTVLSKEIVKDNREIKGGIAFKGKVQGKVFLLFRREQVKSVPVDAIIVSPMTTPDFLPAMKKAAAFVTDEGGITCHAAIVARELKKPCIIGTKIATKVLKDGDVVEVDADKGIVKIIK